QAERSRCSKLRIKRRRASERNRERPPTCPLGSRNRSLHCTLRQNDLQRQQSFTRSSRRGAPEVKVESARLMPGGVADHEITRHRKIICRAKDTVTQWNFRHRQARK